MFHGSSLLITELNVQKARSAPAHQRIKIFQNDYSGLPIQPENLLRLFLRLIKIAAYVKEMRTRIRWPNQIVDFFRNSRL